MSDNTDKNLGVIAPCVKIEANSDNTMLISMRVDSVSYIEDLDTDEYKLMIVSSLFKKILHPDFRPQILNDFKDNLRFYAVMEVPEGILEDTVLAGLVDKQDGILYRYNTDETKGLSRFVTEVKIKEEDNG